MFTSLIVISILATFYDVRLGSDAFQLQTNFSYMFQVNGNMILSGSLYSPKPAGQIELLIISLDGTKFFESNQQFYIAVVAFNGLGRSGQVSNVVKYQPHQLLPESQMPAWALPVMASTAAAGVTALAFVLIKSAVARMATNKKKISGPA